MRTLKIALDLLIIGDSVFGFTTKDTAFAPASTLLVCGVYAIAKGGLDFLQAAFWLIA